MTTATPTNPFLYLQANADRDPHGILLRTADQKVTYAEGVASAKKIAYELRRLGVKAGDIVALDLPDQLSVLFTEAVYHEGAISTVLPEHYVVTPSLPVAWLFTNRAAQPQPGMTVITVDARFLQQVEENPYGISPSEVPIETLRIVFSSGTTGTPKAIALGRSMEAVMDAVIPMLAQAGPSLSLMDTGTAAGIGEFFLSVKAGKPFLSVGGASPEAIVRVITQNAVQSVSGSPAQVAAVVAEAERQGITLPSVERVTVAGTIMPPGLAARVALATDGGTVFTNYGSTEAGSATRRPYNSDDPFDAGFVLPGSVVQIVDENDSVLPEGQVGYIRHRGAGMATEYVGNPDATSRAFRDGWFYPGDLGYLRPDGGLTLAGRESEVLNAGGIKIDPNRIDQFAMQNDKVIDACSFDYETASGLRAIGIALVTDDDIDVKALVARLSTEFGAAAPQLVARVDVIPRNAAGKPLRRTLAEKYGES